MADGPGAPSGRHGPAGAGAAAQVFVDDLEALQVDEDDGHHLLRSLRLRPDELVVASDGLGRWRRCRVTGDVPRPDADTAAWRLLEADGPIEVDDDPGPAVTVGFVPVKGERPEWVVQKLTELGVDAIVVLRSARSVVVWDEERARRSMTRLGRVARQAAAQSRRSRLPELRGLCSLSDLVTTTASDGAPLALADPAGGRLHQGVRALAVGPEGGWDEAERAVPGTEGISLGPQILRAETAALAAGTLLCALRDGRLRPG